MIGSRFEINVCKVYKDDEDKKPPKRKEMAPSGKDKTSESTEKESKFKSNRRILLAVDETSMGAVTWAVQTLTLKPDDQIILVHVDDDEAPIEKGEAPVLSFDANTLEKTVGPQKRIAAVCKTLTDANIPFQGQLRRLKLKQHRKHMEADPFAILEEAIQDTSPDFVVVGSSKRLDK